MHGKNLKENVVNYHPSMYFCCCKCSKYPDHQACECLMLMVVTEGKDHSAASIV